jgi:hypothetical protein
MNKISNKKRHSSIENKLKSYSALAAGLVAFVNNSEAQIVYKDIKPDSTIVTNGLYMLDLNGDGTFDFKLSQLVGSSSRSNVTLNKVRISPIGIGNRILDTSSSNPYPPAINLYASIGPNPKTLAWTNSGSGEYMLNYDRITIDTSNYKQTHHYYGYWQGVTDKYLGLSIKVDGNKYYGWVRLDVAKDAKSFTIKGYAYDSIPDQAILSGDTVITNINKNNELSLKTIIYTHNKNLYVSFKVNEPLTGTIHIYSLSGQLLKSAEIVTSENHVRLEDIASGIYIINIQTSKGIISRKIQLE